jgi:hypothetical protein
MRELDSSSPVSPERWEGGRRQRARHMKALEPGTEMSPCPRGSRCQQGTHRRRHDVVVSRAGMDVDVRGLGGLGRPLHGGCSQAR